MLFTFTKTRYTNGTIEYTALDNNGIYFTREDAVDSARRTAKYWKYNYALAPDVAHASYMETDKGATIYIELKDGGNILTYFEVKKLGEAGL